MPFSASAALLSLLLLPGEDPLPRAKTDPPGRQAPSADLLAQAREMISAFRSGRWEDCARLARAVAGAEPRGFLPAYYLAASHSRLRDAGQGALWLERALEADPAKAPGLLKDPHLAWLKESAEGSAVFRRHEERVQARREGVLRHQRFDFRLPVWDDPRRSVSPADFRGRPLAVLLIARHEDEATLTAAIALWALHEDLGARGLEVAAVHLENPSSKDVRSFLAERFRREAGFEGFSLLGEKTDLFPLQVEVFPAVVFFDSAGAPRFIEEGYPQGEAARYRERAEALLAEPKRAPGSAAGAAPAGR